MNSLKLLIVLILYVLWGTFINGCSDNHESDIHDHEPSNNVQSSKEHNEDDHEHEDGEAQNHQEEEAVSSVNEWEELIGLETAEAFLKPLELTLTVPGRIVPNQNQIAVVSPFIESSINEVFVNIGEDRKSVV